jgi:hypothetical protein
MSTAQRRISKKDKLDKLLETKIDLEAFGDESTTFQQ